MDVEWDPEVAVEYLEQYLANTDAVVTFDAGGVSGHANHKSARLAALYWMRASAGRRVWELESVPIFNKYLFPVDALVKAYFYNRDGPATHGDTQVVSSNAEYSVTRRAMMEGHVSQMRWFRYGWMYLSRYPWVNRLLAV
jgi:N-acetylglucosaminylphosphatidylinositol deacetylase